MSVFVRSRVYFQRRLHYHQRLRAHLWYPRQLAGRQRESKLPPFNVFFCLSITADSCFFVTFDVVLLALFSFLIRPSLSLMASASWAWATWALTEWAYQWASCPCILPWLEYLPLNSCLSRWMSGPTIRWVRLICLYFFGWFYKTKVALKINSSIPSLSS